MTLLPTLKIFLSVEKKNWKTPSNKIYQNLRSFPGKNLWRSYALSKALPLRFTVILLMILKLMKRNFIEVYSEPSRASKMEHFVEIQPFFIVNTFMSNARLKLAKKQAHAKQNPDADLLLFENYSHFSSTLSSKNNRTYSKK